jgi:hypothetical protein
MISSKSYDFPKVSITFGVRSLTYDFGEDITFDPSNALQLRDPLKRMFVICFSFLQLCLLFPPFGKKFAITLARVSSWFQYGECDPR